MKCWKKKSDISDHDFVVFCLKTLSAQTQIKVYFLTRGHALLVLLIVKHLLVHIGLLKYLIYVFV